MVSSENNERGKKIKQRRFFKATMIIVALIAVLFFSYLLIMPAITMVAEPICGDPTHLHTQECFEQKVEIGFICGKEEHTHSQECFDENGNLTCLKEEHTHTGACIEAVIVEDRNTLIENFFHGEVETTEVTLPETVIEDSSKPLEEDTLTEDMLLTSKAVVKQEKYDFKEWITNVRLQVANDGKNFIDYTGDEPLYSWQQLRFNFDYEVPANTLSNINKTIYYQLPYNITVYKEESGKVFNKSGKVIGDYTIDQSGVITIDFYEEFANKNFEGDIIYGSVNFASEISSFETHKDGSVEFIFKDDLKVTIHVEDKSNKQGDLYIQKEQSALRDNNFIDYKITVWSNEGTSDVVKIEDVMSNVIYYNNLKIYDSNGKSLNVNLPQEGDKNFTYDLPKLPANGKYIIEYTACLSDSFTYSTYLNNNVKASSKDSEGNEIEAQTGVSLFYNVNVISKTGEITDHDTIKWTIKINEDHLNIGGFTLIDSFNGASFEKQVTIIGDNKTQSVYLPYTFPENDTNSYIVEYETPKEKMYGSNSAYNKILLQKDNTKYESEQYIFIGEAKPSTVEKSALGIDVDEFGNAILRWHIHIEVGDSIPAGKMFSDFLSDNQYFTAQQARAFLSNFDNLNIKYNAKFYGIGGWWPEYETLSDGTKYGSIRLTLTEPVSEEKIIDFDYETTADIKDLSVISNFSNNFSVDYITDTAENSFTPNIRKYDPSSNDNPSTHTFTEDGLITWLIDFTVPEDPFDVREILPQETTFKYMEIQGDVFEGTPDENNEIFFSFGQDFVDVYKGTKQTIKVVVQINSDIEWEIENSKVKKKSFENKVNLERDGEILDSSSHTQIFKKIDESYEEKIISKSYNGVNATDNLPYTLDINPNKRDLLENGDVINVTDNMTYWGNSQEVLLYLAMDSLKAYEVLDDGSTRLLSEDEYSYSYDFDISQASGKWGNCYNIIKLTLPDSMHIRVEYIYRINGKKDANKWYQFSNSASIEDVINTEPSTQESISITINSSSVVADTGMLRIYKVDSKTTKPLPGVYFKIYKYNGTSYELITDKGNDLFVTDNEGCIELKEQNYNTAYKLEEVMPLENYEKIEPIYFMIYHDDTEKYPYEKPEDFDGVIYRNGMDVFVKNEKPVTSVYVKKKWTDGNGIEDGTKGESAQINLFRTVQNNSDFEHGISTSGTVNLTTKYMPNEWNVWDQYTDTSEYVAGTKLRLNIRCTNQWYTPSNIIVSYNGNVIGGTQNAVYIEKVHSEYYKENVLQYTDYTYEFTADASGELLVNLNYSSLQDLSFELTAISVPETNEEGDENFSDIPYKTIILNEVNNFEYKWDDLPLIGTDEDGNTVHYHYYITESTVPGYRGEIELLEETENSYSFLVTNKKILSPSYNMPATGGFGVYHFYAIGIIIIIFSIIMIFIKKR